MAIKLLAVNDVYNIREAKYMVDEENEKNLIPNEDKVQGTKVLVIKENKEYRMDSTGNWIEIVKGGGGSGGSDLPDVTAADNGKVLGVVAGEWDKMDAPDDEPFVITLTPTAEDFSGTMDKTAAEITEACNAGKQIVADVDASILGFDSCQFIFNGVTLADGRDNVCVQFISILMGTPSKIIYVLTGDSGDNDTSYFTRIYPIFDEELVEHDYTVTYADDTTATLKNVEVV